MGGEILCILTLVEMVEWFALLDPLPSSVWVGGVGGSWEGEVLQ